MMSLVSSSMKCLLVNVSELKSEYLAKSSCRPTLFKVTIILIG